MHNSNFVPAISLKLPHLWPSKKYDMKFDPRIVNELIRARRSTFVDQFIPGQKIPDDIIWQILENANRAPNHGQTEPWRFTVFTGQGLQKLAVAQAELYKTVEGDNFK